MSSPKIITKKRKAPKGKRHTPWYARGTEIIGEERIVFADGGTLTVSHGISRESAIRTAKAMVGDREFTSWTSTATRQG